MNRRRPDPPTGLTAVRVALATTTAGAPRGRRLLGLLSLMLLPVAVLALRVAFDESGRGQGFPGFAWAVTRMYLQLIVPLAMIFLGVGTFGEEWAGGTAHYVLPLPVSRAALVLGRWLACVRRGLLLVLPAIVAVYVLATIAFDVFLEYLPALGQVLLVVSLLVAAYGALFLFLGLALKRAVTTSLAYVFALEVLVANLPQSMASISLAFHGRNLMAHFTEEAAGQDHFRLLTTDIIQVEPPSAAASLLVLALFGAVALALATVVLRCREAGGEVSAGDATA